MSDSRWFYENTAAFAEFLDLVSVGLFFFDDAGVCRFSNRACEKWLGRRPEELSAQEWTEMVHANDRPRVQERWSSAIEQRQPFIAEFRMVHEGRERWVSCSAHVAEFGGVSGFVGVVQDITDRQLAWDRHLRLSEVARMSTMAELVAGVSHEVNQPLNAINMFAAAIRTSLADIGGPLQAQLEKWTDEIVASTRRASEMIRRLRDFADRHPARLAPVDLVSLCHETLELMRYELRTAHVEVVIDAEPSLPRILGDSAKLQQVLVSLIRNACESITEGNPPLRQVTIELRRDGDHARTSVLDTGPGFPAQDLEALIRPFQTNKLMGLGLGLAASRTIVESHEGRLWVESPPGGTVRFTLPIA